LKNIRKVGQTRAKLKISWLHALKAQRDFDAEKTRYYVEYAYKNPGRPFKCETICKLGFCLGERCPIHQARLKGKGVRL